jgi:dienelactone hydrolase
MSTTEQNAGRRVEIDVAGVPLEGNLDVPSDAAGLVLFAHGSGSSRQSPRNRAVARFLRRRGLATLLFDLLTAREDEVDRLTRKLRFDIGLLADRLAGATDWALGQPELEGLSLGYFGASTGAAAALRAATRRPDAVRAVVSRGGRPDLAADALAQVAAPTLLIVGGNDHAVLDLNRSAFERLNAEKDLKVVRGATHLFEEPGALDEVARLACDWFRRHLTNEEE